MIRIVGWIDAPTSGAQRLILAVVLLALFSKPINAKVKALAAKLDAEAERLEREEKHQKEP